MTGLKCLERLLRFGDPVELVNASPRHLLSLSHVQRRRRPFSSLQHIPRKSQQPPNSLQRSGRIHNRVLPSWFSISTLPDPNTTNRRITWRKPEVKKNYPPLLTDGKMGALPLTSTFR